VLDAARQELDPSCDRVELAAGDVSSAAAAEQLVEAALERFGRLDVLVNSTGIFRPVPFLEQTEEHVEEALDSILRPTFYTSQAAARAMVDRGEGGAIVNVGSMWAIDAIRATPTSAYSAAQAGRHSLAKNLAIELAPHAIRVNTVALAFVETPAYERFMTPDEARAVLDSVNAFHPLGRHGQPQDVVEAILFYASERALDHRHHDADRRRRAGRRECPAGAGRRAHRRLSRRARNSSGQSVQESTQPERAGRSITPFRAVAGASRAPAAAIRPAPASGNAGRREPGEAAAPGRRE